MDGVTNIQLKRSTKDKIALTGNKMDTFDDIVMNLYHKRNFFEIKEVCDDNNANSLEEVKRVFKIIGYEVPEDINLQGVVELNQKDCANNTELVIEVYCTIEDILSPL